MVDTEESQMAITTHGLVIADGDHEVLGLRVTSSVVTVVTASLDHGVGKLNRDRCTDRRAGRGEKGEDGEADRGSHRGLDERRLR